MLDRMPKVFAIVVLLCCAVSVCRAGEAPPAWVNAVDTNAMEMVLFGCTNNVAVLIYSTTLNFAKSI